LGGTPDRSSRSAAFLRWHAMGVGSTDSESKNRGRELARLPEEIQRYMIGMLEAVLAASAPERDAMSVDLRRLAEVVRTQPQLRKLLDQLAGFVFAADAAAQQRDIADHVAVKMREMREGTGSDP
jgi:hypothetical protein